MSDFFSIEHPIRFAHRGGRRLFPENTMYAFARAVEDLGYHYIELDVRMSTQRAVDVLGTTLEPGATWEEVLLIAAAGQERPARCRQV